MPLEEAVLDYSPIGAHETHDGAVRERLLVVAARASMITALVARSRPPASSPTAST